MDGRSKLLELQLEKCMWLIKEERLRLGAEEMASQHRAGMKRLVEEMRANCREYALLQGAGRSDARRTAVRYSRLFQKAVDEYVASTALTTPVVDYLDALEKLQDDLVKVLKLQQRRKYTIHGAEATPCACFAKDQKKKEVLALVEQVAEEFALKKNVETQTYDEACGIDVSVQVRPETNDQLVDATVRSHSVGIGDGILIADIDTRPTEPRRTTSAPTRVATPGHRDPSSGGSLSMSSSLENSPSLGDLLTQFRRVLRDETGPSNGTAVPSQRRSAIARRRYDEVKRRIDATGRPSTALSDCDSLSEHGPDRRNASEERGN